MGYSDDYRQRFSDKAPLRDEFNKLFYSLFEKADAYIEIIKIIALTVLV